MTSTTTNNNNNNSNNNSNSNNDASQQLPVSTSELHQAVQIRSSTQSQGQIAPKTIMEHFNTTVEQHGNSPALHFKINQVRIVVVAVVDVVVVFSFDVMFVVVPIFTSLTLFLHVVSRIPLHQSHPTPHTCV